MNRTDLLPILALCAAITGCADTPDTQDPAPEAGTETVTQAVVDPTGDNWIVAGDRGFLEMVGGEDGEPDVVTGRFVLDGNPVRDAAPGADRWVLVGDGQSQPVDDDAQRLRDIRVLLQGQPASFIKPGTIGWLAGGSDGRLQTLDAEGEPTNDEAQVLAGAVVNDGEWNGNTWLVGGGGAVARCTATLSCTDRGQVLNGTVVRAITTTAEPTNTSAIPWVVFGTDSYHRVTGIANVDPSGPVLIEANLDIRDAIFVNGNIAIVTDDGRFGLMDASTLATPTWQPVLGGEAATKIEWNGTEFLVLGVSGWVHRVSDQGTPIGAAVQLATDRPTTAARFSNNRWSIAIGGIGFVEFAAEDLAPLRTLSPVLTSSVRAAAPNGDGNAALLVGLDGNMRMVDDKGAPLGDATQLAGQEDLHAASWNGNAFLVAGEGGFTQLVDGSGAPMGSPAIHNGGARISFAAWSGEFWLIGGEGTYQRLKADGTENGSVEILNGFANIHDARWSGQHWLVAGEGSGSNAVFAIIQRDGVARDTVELPSVSGAVRAVEFTGLEFLLGGTGGLIQRVSSEGAVVDQPINALYGFTIRDIFFNGENYLVGGNFGAIRRLSPELQPLRAAIAVLDQSTVYAITWTRPRGFAGGICIADDFCFEGPCVGGLATGQCCDSACDRVCESCFERDTGETDGTCAPVVADKQPPIKPDSDGCQRESESTCGRTGFCDGAGECQFYSDDIQCGDALCVTGEFTPAAQCDGLGACGEVSVEDCAPYNSCSSEGCETSCETDVSCVDGTICTDGECVAANADMGPDGGDDSGSEDEGCCTTVRPGPTFNGLWLLMMGLFGLIAVRRRR